MEQRPWFGCVIGAALAISSAAHAAEDEVEIMVGSPPMTSDDTETPGPGGIELNLVLAAERDGGARSLDAPLIDFNVGIGERLQLKFELPYRFERADDHARTERGFGAPAVGVKYRFFDDEHSAWAIYPTVEFRTTGALEETPTTLVLPVLYTREFERVALTANLGGEFARGEQPGLFASAGVGTRLNAHNALLVELAARGLEEPDARAVAFNLGLRHQDDPGHAWLFALGTDVLRAQDSHRGYTATVAYQLTFED